MPKTDRPTKESPPQIQSDSLFESLFVCYPDSIVVLDDSGFIQRASDRVHPMFGYSPEELVGTNIDSLVSEKLGSSHEFKTSIIRPVSLDLELFGQKKNGEVFPVDIMLAPMSLQGKKFVVAVVRDITAQKKASLTELFDRRLSLAGELLNPIASMANSLYLLRQSADTPIQHRTLDTLERAVHNQRQIIDKLVTRPNHKGGNTQVLIVEDDLDTASTLDRIIKMWKFNTSVAHDGVSAVKLALELRPKVVLMDLGLPLMDGYEACRVIREHLGSNIRMVAVSGYEDKEERVEEFEDHITKPIEHRILKSLLDGWLK